MDTANLLMQLFDSMQNWTPEVLVAFASISLGYYLKLWPKFKNNLIPIAIIPFAALVYPCVSDWGKVPMGFQVTLVKTLHGMIIGTVSWAVHRVILKKFFDSKIFAKDNGGDTKLVSAKNKAEK